MNGSSLFVEKDEGVINGPSPRPVYRSGSHEGIKLLSES
ncbi:hypothetical protein ISN45_At05g027890 [Arabidopsis thaliana x Arabidopsis arenosa]|uniref:Uncharacterized protein n=2 Tax=Arabidopsis TaxID=3701 RepID=A0A8T2DKF0_ARASU|nr:hypothetical protein ISN45_At05g027890 [Arabidopsis thaliana x Arabidopsis arenosa]KAG7610743.1 hypothetical protein ISN44_As05g027680 [Arabidopsis suecica]